jgi:hypothetical protein
MDLKLPQATVTRPAFGHRRANRLEERETKVYSNIARLKAARYWGVPKIHALFDATYFAGLHKAGMPEE